MNRRRVRGRARGPSPAVVNASMRVVQRSGRSCVVDSRSAPRNREEIPTARTARASAPRTSVPRVMRCANPARRVTSGASRVVAATAHHRPRRQRSRSRWSRCGRRAVHGPPRRGWRRWLHRCDRGSLHRAPHGGCTLRIISQRARGALQCRGCEALSLQHRRPCGGPARGIVRGRALHPAKFGHRRHERRIRDARDDLAPLASARDAAHCGRAGEHRHHRMKPHSWSHRAATLRAARARVKRTRPCVPPASLVRH